MLDDLTTCYRHDDRNAAVSCQRCERPVCTDCMTQASVGFHCPECLRSGGQKVVRARDIGTAKPPVTVALIVINAAIHLLAPNVTIDELPLEFQGLLFGPLVQEGEWWRLITSGFFHADLFHIGFNMFLLWTLGQGLERALGPVRFGLIYLAGLLGGSLAVTIFQFETPTLGASGAVLGLAAAYVPLLWSQGRSIRETPLGGLVILNLVLPLLSPRISFWGHAGGVAFGFAASWLLMNLPERYRKSTSASAAVLGGFCAVLFIAAVAIPSVLGY